MMRSIAARKAARVFPDPVGAKSRVDLPEWISGQPSSWARVGPGKASRNQSWTAGWNWTGSVGRREGVATTLTALQVQLLALGRGEHLNARFAPDHPHSAVVNHVVDELVVVKRIVVK